MIQGFNVPDGYNDYADFDRPQYVLQLAKGPPASPPGPPAPPAPPVPSDIEWSVAPALASCTEHCTGQPRGPTCVETDWPASKAAFRVVLDEFPTGFCGTVSNDEQPNSKWAPLIRPGIARTNLIAARRTTCYYKLRPNNSDRCAIKPTTPGDQRFCPCKDPDGDGKLASRTGWLVGAVSNRTAPKIVVT